MIVDVSMMLSVFMALLLVYINKNIIVQLLISD